tara:strand:- start:1060 stop:1746 length:687 start_codon:yes stop_codon:yes gene_type:complete
MGRIAILLFSLLSTDAPVVDNYNSDFHKDLHLFANTSVRKSYKSSVIVNAIHSDHKSNMGSGNYFKVYRKKFILTALHVVEGAQEVVITDKGGQIYKATIKYKDPSRDLAILTVEEQIKYAKPIDYKIPQGLEIGKDIAYCGHPDGHYFTCYNGMISGTSNQYLLLDVFAWPGASGSAVFDRSGRVIGVLSALPLSAPTGFPILIPNIVRLAPVLHLTPDEIWEVINE